MCSMIKLEEISKPTSMIWLSKASQKKICWQISRKLFNDKKNIQWTQEAAATLQEMKKFVETLLTLTTPIHGEVLMMYLVVSTESINAALFARREKGQVPIYFVSRVLEGAELNYPTLEKLILALVHAARSLRRYFQAHTIAVLTNSSIKQALTKPKKSGHVAKWVIELGEHDIVFQIRDDTSKETPKYFLIEAPPEDNRKEVERKIDTKLEDTKLNCAWKLYTGEASSSDGSGAGLMLIDPEGKEYTYALRFKFEITNNKAEYEALLARLRIAQEMEIVNVAFFVDSQLLKTPKNLGRSELSFNTDPRSMVVRITKQGYYWPSMHRDIARIIQDCEKCKEQSAVRKRVEIGAIAARKAWLFSHWVVSILGPLPTVLGGLKFLVIAIEHSTK
ncbi:reverse transcriptase domain-containing protein [Tanacetum coccineum]